MPKRLAPTLPRRSLRFCLVAGLVIGLVVTLVLTVWEWLENPNGIFHGPEGTHWKFVCDTAFSWFFPTFMQSTPVVFVLHLLLSISRRKRLRE